MPAREMALFIMSMMLSRRSDPFVYLSRVRSSCCRLKPPRWGLSFAAGAGVALARFGIPMLLTPPGPWRAMPGCGCDDEVLRPCEVVPCAAGGCCCCGWR